MSGFGIVSYGTAALVYGAMTAVLLVSHPGGRSANWIVAASAASAVWAAGIVVLMLQAGKLAMLIGLDAMHNWMWTACLLSLLAPAEDRRRFSDGKVMLGVSGGFALIAVAGASTVDLGTGTSGSFLGLPAALQVTWLALLGSGLVGLLALEQVIRNARAEQRGGLRLLCLGVGAIFVVNVFVYSQASLLGTLIPGFWEGRGLASIAAAPLVLIALKRQSRWASELFVSRHIAFYTASLIGVGGYLLAMGLVAYVLRAVGGQWGLWLQIAFLGVALALLAVLLFSSSIRARLRVFLVKHFYRNKYDYREEWLRLTERLGRTSDLVPLAENALAGISRIVGSRRGGLWLKRDEDYECLAELPPLPLDAGPYLPSHPVVAFLRERDWVIDSEQYAREPEQYGHAFGPAKAGMLPRETLIVPLNCQGHLQGFVVLGKPPQVQALNFEDHDILKAAGRQAAVVLAQVLAQEQLTRTRQFEAVNKLTTFLMHDLKNVIAQQELVVANAQRFRHRQDFVDDAIETVRGGVERMRHILDQLSGAALREVQPSRVEVSKAMTEVRASCADRQPVPEVDGIDSPVWAAMEREKLISCLLHLIRNAQDATPAEGRICVSLERLEGRVSITVSDDGEGMDETFIRERLFRPFDSTKGAKGMGIGAYQVREAIRASGGDMQVRSRPGGGTTVRLTLPTVAGPVGIRTAEEPAA